MLDYPQAFVDRHQKFGAYFYEYFSQIPSTLQISLQTGQ
ncbi:hypothetical protein DFAR_2210057 [Desulfarculales bacterium]